MNEYKKKKLRKANEKIAKILNDEVLPLFCKSKELFNIRTEINSHNFSAYPFVVFNGENYCVACDSLEEKILDVIEK